jgi:hypothetical protein
MTTLIITLISLLMYWRIRNLYYETVGIEHRHDLYSLRDKLRRLVIDNKIDKSDPAFYYLDNSISKTIKKIHCINLYSIIIFNRINKDNEFLKQNRKKVNHIINRNKHSKEIYQEYGIIVLNFILKKHYILKLCTILGFGAVLNSIKIIQSIKEYIKSVSLTIRELPETSNIYNPEVSYSPKVGEIALAR